MRIGTKNIEDWGILTSIDVGTPSVKKKEYTVPGLSGKIDASEALTGYPLYENRTVTLEVYVYGKTPEEYQAVYDEIYAYCHGRVREIVLPFDEQYQYEGRLSVSVKQADKSHGIVTISGDCNPYAMKTELTRIEVSSETGEARTVELKNAGMPTPIYIVTDNTITITRGESGEMYSEGQHVIRVPLLIESETIIVSGAANATIYYQEGKL